MKSGYYLKSKFNNKSFVDYIGSKANYQTAIALNDRLTAIVKEYGVSFEDIDWWIDYCLGKDVNCVPAWCNIDQTHQIESYL